MKRIIIFIIIFLPLIILAQQPPSGTYSSGTLNYRVDPTSQSSPLYTSGSTIYNNSAKVTYSADYIHLYPGFKAGTFYNNGFFRALKPLKGSISKTDLKCFGDSDGTATVTASAGYPPYTYLWNNGKTTASISGLVAGSYSCTITDSKQQPLTLSIVINQPTKMKLDSYNVSQYSCSNFQQGRVSLNISGGTPPYICSQCSGGSLNYINNPGTYNVTISDHNNCQLSTVIYISDYQISDVVLSSNYYITQVVCGNSSSIITLFNPDGISYKSNLNPNDFVFFYDVYLEWVDTSNQVHKSSNLISPNVPLISDPGTVKSLNKLTIKDNNNPFCPKFVKIFSSNEDGKSSSSLNNIIENVATVQIFPNPFSKSTNINYSMLMEGNVKISLLDITSRVVKILIDQKQQKGEHLIVLDGSVLETGVYFVSVEINGLKKTEKIIITK